MLPPVNAEIRRRLEGHDTIFLVGSHAFSAHYYTPARAISEDATVLQLDADAAELGRTYPAALGLHGGVRVTLRELAGLLEGRAPEAGERLAAARARQEQEQAAGTGKNGEPTAPEVAAAALVDALPPDTILLEEAITTGLHVRRAFAAERPGSYHHSVGGALGWGIGGSIGLKLARPDAPVVAAMGDGTAMYTIQGLWSAARYEVPVLVVILNNREYRACKQGVGQVVAGEAGGGYVGMDLAPPAIDFPGIAEALGVRGRRAESVGAIAGEVADALSSGRPTLLEIPIAGMQERQATTSAEVGNVPSVP
jgi:benzoylformate decarboxylase